MTWGECLEDARYDAKDWPWWFQTMLRDAHPSSNVHVKWHWLDIHNPSLKFCAIEKIGTKQFRRLQCWLNYHINGTTNLNGNICKWNGTQQQPPPIPPKRVVFLRDPLERYLSAFLDKCLDHHNRIYESHCAPQQVFASETNERLVYDISDDDPIKFFEAYVDTMPLRWNVHFFPQGIYCDGLSRTLGDFDFVGHMDGPRFYEDLHRLGQQYGGGGGGGDDEQQQQHNELEAALETIFDVSQRRRQQRLSDTFTTTTTADDHHHPPNNNNNNKTYTYTETSAATQVYKFYNAKTVRRVLEYLAIDYMTLGLRIPDWAEELLEKDKRAFSVV
jgi:hypothetical protein